MVNQRAACRQRVKVCRRYALPQVSGTEITKVIGLPDYSKRCTSYLCGATEFDPANEDCLISPAHLGILAQAGEHDSSCVIEYWVL